MKNFTTAILAGVAMTLSLAAVAEAKDKVIGVSWSNFQEERWKTDEAAIKAALEAAGVLVGETPSLTAQLARDAIARLRGSR